MLRAMVVGLVLGGALVAFVCWNLREPPVSREASGPVPASQAAARVTDAPSAAAAPVTRAPPAASAAGAPANPAIDAAMRGLPATVETLDDLLHREASSALTETQHRERVARLRALLALREAAPVGDAGRAVLLTQLARTLYWMQAFDELRPVAQQQHRAMVHWYLTAIQSSPTPAAPSWLGLAAIGSATMAAYFGFTDGSYDDMLPRAAEAHGILEQLLPRSADELVLTWRQLEQLRTRQRMLTPINGAAAQMGF